MDLFIGILLLVLGLVKSASVDTTPSPTPTPSSSPKPKLLITSVVEPPFLDMEDDFWKKMGNDRYRGFIVDLLNEMTSRKEIDQPFEIVTSNDGKYGNKDNNGNWNGMIRMLIDEQVHVAAAAIVPTDDTKEVVDFGDFFISGGLTAVMYREENSQEPPFNKTLSDIANNPDITPGYVQWSPTQAFFKKKGNKDIEKIQSRIISKMGVPSPYVMTVKEGIETVRRWQGKYVLFTDYNFGDYYAARQPCNLVLSGNLNSQGYALAFQKGSSLVGKFNDALNAMRVDGKLQEIVDKWYKVPKDKACESYSFDTPARSLRVSGSFAILASVWTLIPTFVVFIFTIQ
ncbi:ionotropic receptor 25a-like [Lineus longissimus]|uniref:ionotropic receptor 25a-like n=1 Tax=Lineus longissimus TaxID=88925 RepID=UPI002B4ECF20